MNPTPDTDPAQDLKKLTDEWATAELHGDTPFLARLLADDFVGVGPRGFLLTREDWLQRITSGALTYEQIAWEAGQVRVYGEAAIVLGRQTQKAHYQGQPVEGELHTTLVFVKQQGHWRLAGLHLSPIAGPYAGPPPAPRA